MMACEVKLMRRRELLKSLAVGAAAADLAAVYSAHDPGAKQHSDVKIRPTRFVETRDGASLFFTDWGAGKPLLFLAPWALNSEWWEHQAPYLAGQRLRCISYDRRGHGRSACPPQGGYDFDTLADDLAAVIEQLNLRDVILVAQSMGCGEAVRYLSRHRASRVSGAVLISTITPFILKTPDNPDGVDRSILEKARAALAKDRPHQVAAAAPAFFGSPKNPVSTEMIEWWTRMIVDRVSLKTLLDLHRIFTETDFRAELGMIRVPTLLIHGDSDQATPLEITGRKTARLIQGSELKVYEGAAHGLPVTHAERLNADLLAFATK